MYKYTYTRRKRQERVKYEFPMFTREDSQEGKRHIKEKNNYYNHHHYTSLPNRAEQRESKDILKGNIGKKEVTV